MLWALGLIPAGMALLLGAELLWSMPLMLLATALCGVAAGVGYCGSLQVVNEIAPPSQRAEVVSAYFVCCFAGNALPVIGIGVLTVLASAATASMAFAGVIAAFALAALGWSLRLPALDERRAPY
jgi:MFS family permease